MDQLDQERRTFIWVDFLWLLFLGGLAVLPPLREIHKQLTLVAIGAVQLFEPRLVRAFPHRGRAYSVVVKIALSTLLLDHTGDVAIESSYYPIYYLPIMTAAGYFGAWQTLLWTTIACGTYLSYLLPALQEYTLTGTGKVELIIRILFFYLVGMAVNRFAIAYRAQTQRVREVAEGLAEANRSLEKAEAAARRSERLAALGQMSAGLAHEIRNPLGVIKGSAEMLNQRLASADALSGELAGYIYTEVNRLSALVSRFLDFARPERLELRPQNVSALVERALTDVWEGPAASNIRLVKHYEQNLPAVLADDQLSERVFVNLAQNACEAMQPQGGTLTVTISTRQPEANGGEGILIRFEDTGPGVKADLREQIFNPFVTTKATGVGLGLSIVSKIMDEHGGWIRLAENNGGGAAFQVFFPVPEQRNSASAI